MIDRLSFVRSSKALGCRLIKLEDAGHGLHGEYADEINEELYRIKIECREKKKGNDFLI